MSHSQTFKVVFLAFCCLILTACTTQYPNQNPTGKMFPEVSGNSLAKEAVQMPKHFLGEPTALLLGYVQNAQFDIDRWLIGLDMTQTQVNFYELPAIAGMFPRMFETQIDNGMRKGIPKELWKGVITLYDDGEALQEFTGNMNPNNARVMLLDAKGKIVYFYDRGFSVAALNDLRSELEKLK